MKKICLALLVFLTGFIMFGQTINNLPVIIMAPLEELTPRTQGQALGNTYEAIIQTAINNSFIFTNYGKQLSDYSLGEIRDVIDTEQRNRIFLLEGSVFTMENSIQLDIKIHDVVTGELKDSSFLEIPDFQVSRTIITDYISSLEISLFRESIGSIEIHTAPGNCEIYLDDVYVGQSSRDSGNFLIERLYPGEYELRVLANGYLNFEDSISIRPRTSTAVDISLSQLPGRLYITSSPKGASIYVDEKLVGQTPYLIKEIKPGEHRVRIDAEDYVSYEEVISIQSKEERTLNAVLEILPGTIYLTSEPEGADIYMRDTYIGRTPYSMYELEPGEYLLELSYPQYQLERVTTVVYPGKANEIKVDLSRQKAVVDFTANYPGVEVFMESRQSGERIALGTAPIRNYEIELGEYRFFFEKEGYYDKEIFWYFEYEDMYVIDADLEFIPGRLKVTSEPEQSIIYLDDNYFGIAPLVVTGLAPGDYLVTAKTSFGEDSQVVTVKPETQAEADLSIDRAGLGIAAACIMAILSVSLYFSVW